MTISTWETTHNAEAVRTCIASGQRKAKTEMLRFVVGPDYCAVPDLDEKLPGRGLWVSAETDLLVAACARDLFSKRARCRVTVTDDFIFRVEGLLARRCIELLQLARRSGIFTAGCNEVIQRLRGGFKGLLVVAADGVPRSLNKIKCAAPNLFIYNALTGSELGAVLGRERLVSAIVENGGLANRLVRDLGRLSGLRQKSTAG